jgi:GWxTD domain-containing protein
MSEWATMGEKTLMDEFEKAQYIVTKTESELFAELADVKAKQKFMYRFWFTRDPNKETIENERLLEYRRAIQYAEIHYANPRIGEGWRTDMGRVLCKYGFPTTIDRGNVVAESKAYQTWYYDRTQGGINFNFVDIHNVNNYVLVHSNAINEVRNENWMNVYVHKSRNDMNNSTNGQRR